MYRVVGLEEKAPEARRHLARSNRRTFRSSKVNDISVFLKHVDLFNRLDGLDVELFKGRLQLLVVCAG